MVGFSEKIFVAAGFALAATVVFAATPQEEAFLKIWRLHSQDPTKHSAIIEACQPVMRESSLGEFLPAVRTLAAWHLLASGKQQDAIRIFEGALISDRAGSPIARSADTMARRWLTRIDHTAVEKDLATYYASNVQFPDSLQSIMSQPNPPPKADRFGTAWVYKAESLKISKAKNQRYSLHSQTLGTRLTALKQFPFTSYGKRLATIVTKRQGNPVLVEFETVADGAAPLRGTASEGSSINGIRFLKLSSDGQFALMIENDSDFWIVATIGGR